MKKLIIVLLIMFASILQIKAQQVVMYNQYQIDPFNVNPAFAGMDEKIHVNLCFRKNWAGIPNSPVTYYISGHSRLGERPPEPYDKYSLRISQPQKYESLYGTKKSKVYHALGGIVQNDRLGAFARLNAGLSYAAHLKLKGKMNLALGLQAGLLNYTFDKEGLILAFPDDQTYIDFLTQNTSSTFMNLNAGLVLYSDKFEFQYAAQQLLRNQIWFVNNSDVIELQIHHYLGFAYIMSMEAQKIRLKPSVMLRYVSGIPLSVDVNLLAEFDQKFWAGLSYRLKNSAIVLLGMNYKQFRFGYAYDYNTAMLPKSNSGSHELFIGMNF